MTFATTTDGNHGRGVAWAAQQLGQNAVIYMPKGSAQERVDAILNLGAECIVTDMNYDDTVRLTMQHAQQHGWEVVQDTAWEGYTKIPTGSCKATQHWRMKPSSKCVKWASPDTRSAASRCRCNGRWCAGLSGRRL